MPGATKPAGAPMWIVTFADLMSLLLCFFVLLLSFSVMDVKRYADALGSIQDAFGIQQRIEVSGLIELDGNPVAKHARHLQIVPVPKVSLPPEAQEEVEEAQEQELQSELENWEEARDQEVEKLAEDLRKAFESEVGTGVVDVDTNRGDISITFPDELLFSTGQAFLQPAGYPVMDALAESLAETSGEIIVIGHTDNVPISTAQFPSNWELSSARGIAVLRRLELNPDLDPSRLGVAGFADSRPIADNTTAEGRAKNRRVQVLVRYPAPPGELTGETGEGSASGSGSGTDEDAPMPSILLEVTPE